MAEPYLASLLPSASEEWSRVRMTVATMRGAYDDEEVVYYDID